MKSLFNYINKNNIDGHIHFFSQDGCIFDHISTPDQYTKSIGFMDIDFKDLTLYNDKLVLSYYSNFINKYYDSKKHILLATGITPEQMIMLHKTYPNIIKGFGEIKCYEEWKHGDLPYGNLNWFKKLLDYNKQYCLPVYIHWGIWSDDREEQFEELLKEYPEIPFVLCHYGLDKRHDLNKSYELVTDLLLKNYSNLYTDISYTATKYFIKHPDLLKSIKNTKVLIGSDINMKSIEHNKVKEEYDRIHLLDEYINCNNTINLLFKS